jgi:hypothetical protein
MKRDGGKKRRRIAGFDSAGAFVDQHGVPLWKGGVAKVDDSSLARALEEIEETRALAKSAAPLVGDQHMQTQTVDVNKAAIAIVKKFDDTVDDIAKRYQISRGKALLKVASSGDHADLWASYRAAQQIVGTQLRAAPEPEPVVLSDAYQTMMAKAAKRAAKHGTNVATEFAKLYADPANRDLLNEDRAAHFAKAAGGSRAA